MRVKKVRLDRPNTVFVLPSLFSIINLFFGFKSVILTFHGRYRAAAFWIILAAVMDGLDGIVARATKSSSDFGVELDSLSDSVSFGLATSVLLYFWGMKQAGGPGVFFSFLFLTAGLLRLARYNIRTKVLTDRRHYQGLTVPSAAIFMSAVVNYHSAPLETVGQAVMLMALTVAIALCMVSTLPYPNYIKLVTGRRIDVKSAFFMAVTVAAILFYPRIAILVIFGINVFSGPAVALARTLRKPAGKKRELPDVQH